MGSERMFIIFATAASIMVSSAVLFYAWLDQKPRALVELFIVIAVFAAPLMRCTDYADRLQKGMLSPLLAKWIFAPRGLLIAGVLYLCVRVSGFLSGGIFDSIGDSELREFTIA